VMKVMSLPHFHIDRATYQRLRTAALRILVKPAMNLLLDAAYRLGLTHLLVIII